MSIIVNLAVKYLENNPQQVEKLLEALINWVVAKIEASHPAPVAK